MITEINTKGCTMKTSEIITMRTAFPEHQISKLPKPTKAQTDAVKADFKAGVRCPICGGWHHPQVVHLDYVGHAALTDRLLDVDEAWSWEPVALDSNGLPAIDKDGGLWIKLTVNGVTRLGYGDAQGKTGGDAMKERIGDALRNAAMRFGAALDLWHKGDLHKDDDEPPATKQVIEVKKESKTVEYLSNDQITQIQDLLKVTGVTEQAVCSTAKVKSLKDIEASRFAGLLTWIDSQHKGISE
jgi:hypothetical protein